MNLIIPINVQALCVTPLDVSNQNHSTKNPTYFAGQQTDYNKLPWINKSGTPLPSDSALNLSSEIMVPLADAPRNQLLEGIHLHWQLPDALTKGSQTQDGILDFPAVPNRWLVTRFLDDNGTVATKQWIIESDQLLTTDAYLPYTQQSSQTSNAIPVGWEQIPNNVQYQHAPYRFLGRVYEIEQWPDPTQQTYMPTFTFTSNNLVASGLYNATSLGKLKAVGSSGPTFAAYYPDCVSVFGFRDSFYDQDKANGQKNGTFLEQKTFSVSYQVVGWHDCAKDDPLQMLLTAPTDTNDTDWQAKVSNPQTVAELIKAAYNWAYTAQDSDKVPERCLYSGAVLSLPWNKTLKPLAILEETDDTVRVGIGNSTVSAFATLLAQVIKETSEGWFVSNVGKDNLSQADAQALDDALDAMAPEGLQALTNVIELLINDPSLKTFNDAQAKLAADDRQALTTALNAMPAAVKTNLIGLVNAVRNDSDTLKSFASGLSMLSAAETMLANAPDARQSNGAWKLDRPFEFFLAALQLGLLNQLSTQKSIASIENALQQSSFGAVDGGSVWSIRKKSNPDDEAINPGDFSDELGTLLDELNIQQRCLDSLLDVIESIEQTIFVDWYQTYSNSDDIDLSSTLTSLVANEILDLWAKKEAAFGIKRVASPRLRTVLEDTFKIAGSDFESGMNNYPQFYSGRITLQKDGKTFMADALPGTLSAKVAALATQVLSQLGDTYEVYQSAAPRFWAPNDLVMAISSEQVQPAMRNGRVRFLPVRQSSDILSNVVLSLNNATHTFDSSSVTTAIPWKPLTHLPSEIASDAAALLVENCLLNAAALAEIAKQQQGPYTQADLQPLTQQNLIDALDAWNRGAHGVSEVIPETAPVIVNPSIHAENNRLSIAWTGTMPQGLALTYQSGDSWENPFLPLFMMWKVQFNRLDYPQNGTGYSADFIKKNFHLDHDLFDYTLGQNPLSMSSEFSTLTNNIIISSRAPLAMVDQIVKYLSFSDNVDTDEGLSNIVNRIRHLPTLSGGLSSLNLSFLTREANLQMVPFNPSFNKEHKPETLGSDIRSSNTDFQNFLTWFVANSVPITQVEQVPNGQKSLYEPLRTGYFTLTELAVVDVFGRKRILLTDDDANYNQKVFPSWQLAHNIKCDSTSTANIARYYLPPRIIQASRLLMRWLSANNGAVESNDHPISSPICGWVVANYFDNSLMLFDKDGQPLGSVGAFGGQPFATWQSVPGAPAQSIMQDLAKANEEVRRFAFFFYRKPRERFQSMLDAIGNAQSQMLPHDLSMSAQSQAILMSQPLALARISLRLELQGLPAFNTSSTALEADLKALGYDNDDPSSSVYDWKSRTYNNLLGIDFPVQLGDNNDFDDGLVAYFTADDTTSPQDEGRTYPAQMYAPAANAQADTAEAIRQPKPDTIQLKLCPRIDLDTSEKTTFVDQINNLKACGTSVEAATILTLLLDPRSKVHALTGILPVKAITIPSEQYITALSNLEVTFFTHPILRPVPGIQMPIPPEPGFTWQWITALKYKDDYDFDNPIKFKAVEQALSPQKLGDRAFFAFSPQVIEDGWLGLKRTEDDKKDTDNG